MAVVLDKLKDGYIEYDAVFIDPQNLGVLNNEIAMNILKEMTLQPMCAMDLARKLGQHEQKIYYHLNKLSRAGIIKLVGTEKRYGMVAQLYDIVSPVVAAKINENGKVVVLENDKKQGESFIKFLYPFVNNGKLNSKIIVGDPYPHGKFNAPGKSAAHIFDFVLMLGNSVNEFDFKSFLMDTKTSDKDLLDNLILIGNIKENVIINKINDKLKYKFSDDANSSIIDNEGNNYTDPRTGILIKTQNPLNPSSKILIIGGVGSRGTRSAIIAATKEFQKIADIISRDGDVYIILEGIDQDGDGLIDSINILK